MAGGTCVAGGVIGRGHAWPGCAWQGGVHGRGHAWQGGVYGKGGMACMCGMDGMHACPPPLGRMTDACKNITLPQTSFAGGN